MSTEESLPTIWTGKSAFADHESIRCPVCRRVVSWTGQRYDRHNDFADRCRQALVDHFDVAGGCRA